MRRVSLPSFWSPRFSSVSLIAFVLAASAGCVRDENMSQGALSIPPDGSIRILSRKIEQTPDRLHWKWSLIGERNWVEPTATEKNISLAMTYPTNGTERHDGTNIWEVDLTVEKKQQTLGWNLRVHGVNGSTREANGTAPLPPGAGENAVQIELDRDSVERLPANITLARVAEKTVTLHLAR